MYSWPGGELKQTLDLGNTGLLPLEVSTKYIGHLFIFWYAIGPLSEITSAPFTDSVFTRSS